MNNALRPSLKTIRARLLPIGQPPHSQKLPLPVVYIDPENNDQDEVGMKFPFELSEQVLDLLARRTLIEKEVHHERNGEPRKAGLRGQIVCVESLLHKDLCSGQAQLPSPTFVLLDKPKFVPSEIDIPEIYKVASEVWQGWLVGPDADYMNEWDVLLNDDALREDSCQFVQTWNRVEVYLPCVHRVAGFVNETLLININYLSKNFTLGVDDETTPKISSAGQLVQRQLPHGWICTGSRLNDSDQTDPRNSYVQMYGQYSELFSDAVWSMLRDMELQYSSVVSIVEKSSFTVGNVIARLLNLINNAGSAPQKAGAGALTVTKNRRDAPANTQPRFILEWTQNELTWRMEGWRHGELEEVLLTPPATTGIIPKEIIWKSVNNQDDQRFAVTRDARGLFLINIKLIKVMRRIEKVENARNNGTSSELLAEMLPIVHI